MSLFLIPQPQHEKSQTGEKRYRFHGLKQRHFVLHGVESVVRNARIEVMDVMKSDIAAEELQYLRKFVKGTTFQRRVEKVPLRVMFPIRLIKLVLHVEEPYAECAGHPQRRQHNADKRNESDQKTYPGRYRRNGGGGIMNAPFFPRTGVFRRETVCNDKHCQRADDEHADRIPVDAVPQASVPRQCEVFLHRQHPHVAGAAMVEIAAGSVVDVVVVAPFIVRGERDQSGKDADDIVGAL